MTLIISELWVWVLMLLLRRKKKNKFGFYKKIRFRFEKELVRTQPSHITPIRLILPLIKYEELHSAQRLPSRIVPIR